MAIQSQWHLQYCSHLHWANLKKAFVNFQLMMMMFGEKLGLKVIVKIFTLKTP